MINPIDIHCWQDDLSTLLRIHYAKLTLNLSPAKSNRKTSASGQQDRVSFSYLGTGSTMKGLIRTHSNVACIICLLKVQMVCPLLSKHMSSRTKTTTDKQRDGAISTMETRVVKPRLICGAPIKMTTANYSTLGVLSAAYLVISLLPRLSVDLRGAWRCLFNTIECACWLDPGVVDPIHSSGQREKKEKRKKNTEEVSCVLILIILFPPPHGPA